MRSFTTFDLQYAHRFFGFKGEAQYEYYVAAEPPVRCGESHSSGRAEPPCCYSV